MSKKIVLFFLLVIMGISFLPLYNLYPQLKKINLSEPYLYNQLKKIDFSKSFNIDIFESYLNYYSWKFFNISLNSTQVIAGDDSFLFLGNDYADVLDNHRGLNKVSTLLKNFDRDLKNVENWYLSKKIPFVFVIAPNKHSIYNSFLPENYKKIGPNATDNVINIINVSNNRILDLRDSIGEQFDTKDLKYHKLDTHWNKYGAFLGYKSIINHINEKYKLKITPISVNFNKVPFILRGADLSMFLKASKLLTKKDADPGYDYKNISFTGCVGNINLQSGSLGECIESKSEYINVDYGPRYTINNGLKAEKLHVLLLGDSFLAQHSEVFSSTFTHVYRWHYKHIKPHMLYDFIKLNKVDMVIQQIAERDMHGYNMLRLPTKRSD
jgi:alginate O-acetyltransferase complex protein AlgJ